MGLGTAAIAALLILALGCVAPRNLRSVPLPTLIRQSTVEAVDPSKAGAADVSFTAGLVDQAIDGLGLMGVGGHTVDEVADLRTLPSQTKRAALLMLRLAQEFQR